MTLNTNERERARPMRVIYLSGPMKGYPESNYPAFHEMAAQLRAKGHRVYNPAEFPHRGPGGTFPLRQAFASYCNFICLEADTIALLPGWEASKGVGAELALAKNCGLDVVELSHGWLTPEYFEARKAEEKRLRAAETLASD